MIPDTFSGRRQTILSSVQQGTLNGVNPYLKRGEICMGRKELVEGESRGEWEENDATREGRGMAPWLLLWA